MAVLAMLDRRHTIARWTYNRWLVIPAALAIHLSIGQAYALSVFKKPFVEHFGTGLTPIAVIFSLAMVMLGLSAAVAGTWIEAAGPRKAMFVAALCWPGGFAIAAAGIATHQLWLVYLGYGFVGGIGLGIGYISPVSTLIRWFPDRPGLAAGLAIMGFGGGALIASPLSNTLLLDVFGDVRPDGLVPTFLTLGALYFVVMMIGAFTVRVPPDRWTPPGWDPNKRARHRSFSKGNVRAANAIRTPQFWLLWTVLFCNITAGIGILEQAAPMIQDFFPSVSATAAGGYVALLALCNMAGRAVWSATSDYIGRKPTYVGYLGVGALLYLAVALLGTWSVGIFVVLTGVILSFYGGVFATIPAYVRDLFGVLQVGAIHGRLLTAWSAAGVAGPLIVNVVADSQKALGKSGAQLYTVSVYVMVGLLLVGLVANLMVHAVADWFYEPTQVFRPLVVVEG
jgi:MFS family permease